MTADHSNSPSIDLYQRLRAGRILSSEMQQWHFAMSGLETDCIVTLRYVGLEGEERRWVGGPRSQTMSLCMRFHLCAGHGDCCCTPYTKTWVCGLVAVTETARQTQRHANYNSHGTRRAQTASVQLGGRLQVPFPPLVFHSWSPSASFPPPSISLSPAHAHSLSPSPSLSLYPNLYSPFLLLTLIHVPTAGVCVGVGGGGGGGDGRSS